MIHRKTFYKIRDERNIETTSCTKNGRFDILKDLFISEDLTDRMNDNIFKNGFYNWNGFNNDDLYHLCLHPINPFQYILENDLHYKLYKGYEDILNEYEHDIN